MSFSSSSDQLDLSGFLEKVEDIESLETIDKRGLEEVLQANRDDKFGKAISIATLLTAGRLESITSRSSDEYQKRVSKHWSASCVSQPKLILLPKSADHVALILAIITLLDLRFAIRSGGANPNRGWAGIDDGVLIDISCLDRLSINEAKTLVALGAGLEWSKVYDELDRHDVTVLGARMPGVGVGGLVIGGGIPNFSSEYGLVCDRVVEFEVVLSDSRIVRANRNEYEDLYWALKGGGPNFGVVTSVTVGTVPVREIWYGAWLYDSQHNHAILNAVHTFTFKAEADPKASFTFSLGNTKTFVGVIYSQPLEFPEIFSDFYSIPIAKEFIKPQTGQVGSLIRGMSQVLGPVVPKRRAIVGLSIKPNDKLIHQLHTFWQGVADKFNILVGGEMTFGIQPLTTSALSFQAKNGGSPLNLKPIPQLWLTAVAQYYDAAHDAMAHAAVQEFAIFARAKASEMGLLLDFIFMNDSNWEESPLYSYGATSLEKLVTVSLKYDKSQVFQLLQGDGFLLKKVMSSKVP